MEHICKQRYLNWRAHPCEREASRRGWKGRRAIVGRPSPCSPHPGTCCISWDGIERGFIEGFVAMPPVGIFLNISFNHFGFTLASEEQEKCPVLWIDAAMFWSVGNSRHYFFRWWIVQGKLLWFGKLRTIINTISGSMSYFINLIFWNVCTLAGSLTIITQDCWFAFFTGLPETLWVHIFFIFPADCLP